MAFKPGDEWSQGVYVLVSPSRRCLPHLLRTGFDFAFSAEHCRSIRTNGFLNFFNSVRPEPVEGYEWINNFEVSLHEAMAFKALLSQVEWPCEVYFFQFAAKSISRRTGAPVAPLP